MRVRVEGEGEAEAEAEAAAEAEAEDEGEGEGEGVRVGRGQTGRPHSYRPWVCLSTWCARRQRSTDSSNSPSM